MPVDFSSYMWNDSRDGDDDEEDDNAYDNDDDYDDGEYYCRKYQSYFFILSGACFISNRIKKVTKNVLLRKITKKKITNMYVKMGVSRKWNFFCIFDSGRQYQSTTWHHRVQLCLWFPNIMTNPLPRLQTQTLPKATPPIGKIHTFSKFRWDKELS